MVSLTSLFTFFQHNSFIYCLKIIYMFMRYVDHKYPLFSPPIATRKPYDIPLSSSCPFVLFFSAHCVQLLLPIFAWVIYLGISNLQIANSKSEVVLPILTFSLFCWLFHQFPYKGKDILFVFFIVH